TACTARPATSRIRRRTSTGSRPKAAAGPTIRTCEPPRLQRSETAYAKINLALHVRRRRGDGYHELETLFAFVDAGDRLTARSSARDEVRVVGEFAVQLTDPFANIVSN